MIAFSKSRIVPPASFPIVTIHSLDRWSWTSFKYFSFDADKNLAKVERSDIELDFLGVNLRAADRRRR